MVKGRSISVNLQKGRGAVLAVWLGLAAAGCGTFSHYPQGMEQTTLAPLRAGQKTDYEKTFQGRTNGSARVLFAMEMGRTAQLEGDFAASRAAFATAIAATEEQDDRAVVSARGVAAQGGAVLVNDKAIPYRAPGYERTLVHHYQALNYLAAGDLIGAGVEVRRANREQGEALERHEREIEKTKPEEAKGSPEAERDPHLGRVYAGLDQLAGSVKSSFQNAATFYVSAVIWEMLGEPNDAYIDVKKALEIAPEHPDLQRDALRLGRRLGMREDVEDFEKRFPEAAAASEPPKGKARLVVIYEEGLVPKKAEVSIPYPLPASDSIGMIALPTYEETPSPPTPATVAVGGAELGRTAPICDVGALAARALSEQMPIILARQIARSVAKGVAAKAAHDGAGDWGELAATLYNVFSEQADLRSWLTLPAQIQMLSAWTEPGTRRVELSAPGGGSFWSGEVTLKAGRATIVHAVRIDLAVYSHVIVQP